jgi:hypothetical protein
MLNSVELRNTLTLKQVAELQDMWPDFKRSPLQPVLAPHSRANAR